VVPGTASSADPRAVEAPAARARRPRLRRRLVGGAVIGLLTSLAVGMVLTFEMVLANEGRALDVELLEQRAHFEGEVREGVDEAPADLEGADRAAWSMRRFVETESAVADLVSVVWAGGTRIGSTAFDADLQDLVGSGRFDLLPVGELRTVHTAVGDLRALRVDVLDGATVVGSYAVAGPLAPARHEAFEALGRLAIAALVSLLVGWLVVEVAVRRVLRPLGRLTSAAATTEIDRFAGAVEVEGDDEVADLTREFNAMLTRLDEASADRERLLATISHELRTPLAVARAKVESAQLALGGAVGEQSVATDSLRTSLALARDELERMSRLVGDLLTLGRSGHGGFLQPRVVDLRDLVRDLELRVDGLGLDTVTVAPGPAALVVADGERLLQAVLNCVQNAIAHNPPGTIVDVRMSMVSDRVVIRVVDDGVGIPAAERERVLQPFVSLEGAAGRSSHSTGVGLAVVAAIARAHDGLVRILDAPVDHDELGATAGSAARPGTMIEISFPARTTLPPSG
jgi:two-component system OmpR family sensor kinase